MHRSGTSALAEVLVRAGAWFTDRRQLIASATAENPLGLVERKDVINLNNHALAAVKCNWHEVSAFRPQWPETFTQQIRQRFRAKVLDEMLQHGVSVLKDPRLCLTLPLYRPIIRSMAAVMIVRHPVEVAMSLERRNKFRLPFGVALWETYNRHALSSLQGVPSILVQHTKLLSEPQACIAETIAGLAELGITGLSVDAAIAANSIDPTLYRNRSSAVEEYQLGAQQQHFWQTLQGVPAASEVPPGELSPASRQALREHRQEIACARQKPAPQP